MSNRRQPARQARTNPPRNATSAGRPFGGRGSLARQNNDQTTTNTSPGFFPAITHFTDSITALPKEMSRHYTMLKEVDAKICGPEDELKQLVNAALKAPIPIRKDHATLMNLDHNSHNATGTNPSAAGSTSGPIGRGVSLQGEIISQAGQEVDVMEYSRRQLFFKLRMVAGDMLTTLDEKNHVISTATDALDRQLKRCESSYTHINDEISEEARLGNPHHWAYMDKTAEKKGTTASERTRRDAAVANGLAASIAMSQEGELAALRSEARREAVAARKRHQHVESDFDDSRAPKKQIHNKGRKIAEINVLSTSTGLGVTNVQSASGTNPPSKRRKVEKPLSAGIISGVTVERSLSSVYGPTATAGRGTGTSPRETPAAEPKKRVRAGTLTNGAGRRRTGTNASAVNSPLMASSPVVGTFALAGGKGGNSPAIGAMQRSQSTRGRQNSAQTVQETLRSQQPPSTSTKHSNSNGTSIPQLDGPSAPRDTKSSKDSTLKTEAHTYSEADARTSSRSHDRLSRSDPDPPPSRSRADRPPSISTTRTSGKASKAATPLSSSFPEQTRPRSGRNTEPAIKRSHKKGAGILAQQQLLAAQQAEEEVEGGEDMEGEDEDHVGELRYCYCNGYSYGEMVACDYDGCEREWFHLECAGLTRPPKKESKWYCDDCKKKVKV